VARIEERAGSGGLGEGQRRLEKTVQAVHAYYLKDPLSSLMKFIFFLLCFTFSFVAESQAQRNDLTRGNSKKEKTENDALTYDRAIRLYGPPDQEKQMKDGTLVCTWVQVSGVHGDASGVYGGVTSKMIIFFGQDGVMKDRKFVNGALICPDWAFRLR
jgi:hypothetical protein